MKSGMGLSRKLNTGGIPYWQRVDQLVQGGLYLNITGLTQFDGAGNRNVIPGGTPMIYDESTRIATPVTVGVMAANATSSATTYNVAKGSRYKVGDNFALTPGGAAYAITAIDTSNVAYDTITVATTVGAATAGQFTFASSANGATAGAFGGINGVLYDDVVIEVGRSCSIVLRGTAYARRVPYSAALDAALKAAGTFIIYSQSY